MQLITGKSNNLVGLGMPFNVKSGLNMEAGVTRKSILPDEQWKTVNLRVSVPDHGTSNALSPILDVMNIHFFALAINFISY